MLDIKKKQGFSLVELVVAMGIFSILAAGVLYVVISSYRGFYGVSDRQVVAEFAQEGMEVVKAIANENWKDIQDASGSSHGVVFHSEPKTETVVTGLTGRWMFNEGSDTTTYDTVGSNDGTISDAEWATGCINGNCLDFEGATTDRVELGSAISLTGAFTVSVWINYDNNNTQLGICSNQDNYGNGRISFYQAANPNTIRFRTNAGSVDVTTNQRLVGGDWHLLTITRDGDDNIKVYRDGIDVTTGAWSRSGTLTINRLGDQPDDSGWSAWDGYMYDFRIYNGTALTEAQALEIYNSITKPGLWYFVGTSNTLGDLTRVIAIADVQRDLDGNIVASGGVDDPQTKKVTVTVSGTGITDYVLESYITDWTAMTWEQTDWSGSTDERLWSGSDLDNLNFASSSYSNVSTSTAGILTLSGQYDTPGYLYSSIFTIDSDKVLRSATIGQVVPSGCTLDVTLEGTNDVLARFFSTTESQVFSDTSSTTYFEYTSTTSSDFNALRFFRYKVDMTACDGNNVNSSSPALYFFRLNFR